MNNCDDSRCLILALCLVLLKHTGGQKNPHFYLNLTYISVYYKTVNSIYYTQL